MSPTYCPRCGHYAESHSGSFGCIGRDTDGSDCWCQMTYRQIVPPPPGDGPTETGDPTP